ncbi:potassium transporter TrkG [Nocardioides lentus]|uniref:Potassium transporter TrkG n=1 Tax=Nocardioides lentus TaxID=338077 RepID=A0ABN2PR42_9ACTN
MWSPRGRDRRQERRTLEARQFARRRRSLADRPGRAIVLGFAGVIGVGTAVLLLPVARAGEQSPGLLDAFFTATSAVSVTGLNVVDTPTYWSTFGHVAILALCQAGGFGIMALASLLGLLVTRRLGLRSRLTTVAEAGTVGLGEVREVLFGLIRISLVVEAAVALVLWLRLWLGYDEPPGRAAWYAVFHAVSSFNNAGFSLWSDSLVRFVGDPWIVVPVCVAVFLGSIGLPVLMELSRRVLPVREWSLHTRMTVGGWLGLMVLGWVVLTAFEWTNPDTLGGRPVGTRLLGGLAASVLPRSAGLQTVDYADVTDESLVVTTVLMFIGGGAASAGGGIKVTTLLLLLLVIAAEVRGSRDVEVAGRRLGPRTQRQAVAVTTLTIGILFVATLLMMALADLGLGRAAFETASAFSTAGLSSVGTGSLPDSAQLLLVVLMFVGRIGPVTLVSALALRDRPHLYRYPEGRPLIG